MKKFFFFALVFISFSLAAMENQKDNADDRKMYKTCTVAPAQKPTAVLVKPDEWNVDPDYSPELYESSINKRSTRPTSKLSGNSGSRRVLYQKSSSSNGK